MRYFKCPICSHLPGQCAHLSKKGVLKKIKKLPSAQAQKYSINPLWRTGRRRNQGER